MWQFVKRLFTSSDGDIVEQGAIVKQDVSVEAEEEVKKLAKKYHI